MAALSKSFKTEKWQQNENESGSLMRSSEKENILVAIIRSKMLRFLEKETDQVPLIGTGIINPRERRKRVDRLLLSWGEWKTSSGRMTGRGLAALIDGEVGIGEGYDHALLSDHDSNMILIDQAISRLQLIDQDLLEHEYVTMHDDRRLIWGKRWSRSPQTYKNRKSHLLDYLANQVLTKLPKEK